MELRRFTLCLAFFVLAVISHCSEARHSLSRRGADYSDDMLNDESNDYGAQNDADGGNDADEEEEMKDGSIISKPDTYRLQIGKTVRLECRVTPPEYTVVSWSKDDEKLFFGKNKLKASNRFNLVEGSSDLIIKDLEINDTGRYTCEIMQENAVSIVHTVIVEEPPRVINPESSTEYTNDNEIAVNNPRIVRFSASDDGFVREGSDLLLTCEVSGTPKPTILWSRQKKYGFSGAEALTESHGQFSDHTLFMKNVTREDSGVYYCYALSDAGNDTAKLHVQVAGKPRVHVHKTVINTDINVQAELQCTVHDDSNPHIRWYKDGIQMEDTSVQYNIDAEGARSTLTVTPRTDTDFGTYTCQAENAHGRHNKSIELVQSPVIEDLDAAGPKLTWTVHSHQPLEDIEVSLKQFGEDGQWTTFKVPLPESKDKHRYELIYAIDEKTLEAGTYEATVKVKNNKSWSRYSDPAVVKLENQPEPIQTASVFRDSGACDMRPTTVLLSTAIMYLLVRML